MEKSIKAVVEGGKATAGPPLGPALGPLGVNTAEVVKAINSATSGFKGMKVPVVVFVDTSSKSFRVEVGSPPTSELLKKEAGVSKGRTEKGSYAGDISFSSVVNVAKSKEQFLLGGSLKSNVKQVLGTCLSVGLSVDGKNPKEAIREVSEGNYDKDLS